MRNPLCLMGFILGLGLGAAAPAFAKVDIEQSGTSKTMRFTIDDVRFGETMVAGQKFATMELAGVDGYTAVQYREGEPELPVLRFFTTGHVRVKADARIPGAAFDTTLQLKPAQPARIKLPGQAQVLVMNDARYQSTEVMPSKLYSVEIGRAHRLNSSHIPLSRMPSSA